MVTDWVDLSGEIGAAATLDVQADGRVVAAITRIPSNNAYRLYVMADVDGPVHSALMQVMWGLTGSETGCALMNEAANEGKHLYQIYGDNFHDTLFSKHIGLLGGAYELLHAPVLVHYPNEDFLGWDCGAQYVVKESHDAVMTAYSWDMSEQHVVTSAATDPDHINATLIQVFGPAIFWTTGTMDLAGVNSWDAVNGMRPLVRWPGDPTHGAGALGTDGTDMVWLQGDKEADAGNYYPNLSFWTAPFTTDPAALVPRRLRSMAMKNFQMERVQVGCGYASIDAGIYGIAVVRLSDGQGWYVPDSDNQNFNRTLAVTCDEIFVRAIIGGKINVARIRLDSLGPGVAAD